MKIAHPKEIWRQLVRLIDHLSKDTAAMGAILIGVAALLLAPHVGESANAFMLFLYGSYRPGEVIDHLTRDLGIALVISGVVGSLIEKHLNDRRVQAGKNDERGEVVRRVVLQQAMKQIGKVGGLGPIFCRLWHLETEIGLRDVVVSGGSKKKRYVSVGTLEYTLVSAGATEQPVVLRHELERDVKGRIDGTRLPLMTNFGYVVRDATKAVVSEKELDFPKIPIRSAAEGTLKFDPSTGDVEALPILLPPGGEVCVKMTRVEAVGTQFPWYMYWVTERVMVKVTSRPGDGLKFRFALRPKVSLENTANHPERALDVRDLLPGQGFSISILGKEGDRD
jgi:hypothetical protein